MPSCLWYRLVCTLQYPKASLENTEGAFHAFHKLPHAFHPFAILLYRYGLSLPLSLSLSLLESCPSSPPVSFGLVWSCLPGPCSV